LNSDEAPVYIGIDPGLGTTGYGVLRFESGNTVLIDAGTIKSSPDDLLPARLDELYTGLIEVIDSFHPEAMGLEQVYSHYRHPATAIKMGHARGVLCLAGQRRNLRIIPLPSTTIKKLVTGKGRASKEQVAGMVRHLLGISEEIRPDDVTDALAAAIAAYESERYDRKYKRNSSRHG
jgi:crossover junction endodeoxyribonuclease RuvC